MSHADEALSIIRHLLSMASREAPGSPRRPRSCWAPACPVRRACCGSRRWLRASSPQHTARGSRRRNRSGTASTTTSASPSLSRAWTRASLRRRCRARSAAPSRRTMDDGLMAMAADREDEPALLERAKEMGCSKDRRYRAVSNAIEVWNLADTEAWKSTRAFLARSHVERFNWETCFQILMY
jgi:hypothetical protein